MILRAGSLNGVRESLVKPACHFCSLSEKRRLRFLGAAHRPFFICVRCVDSFGGTAAVQQIIDKIPAVHMSKYFFFRDAHVSGLGGPEKIANQKKPQVKK